MEKIIQEELDIEVSLHRKWLRGEDGGKRLDLSGRNLTGADLTRADLTWADLAGADLTGADLTRANLTRADLTGADLTGADLTRANLTRADLTWADLTEANLTGANLTRANLTEANLTRANLTEANLTRANLTWADLTDVKNMLCPMACPDTGSFIAWKKAVLNDGSYAIIKLRILADSKRSSSTGRKCRTDKADVLEIQSLNDGTLKNYASSKYDASFYYVPGATVRVPDFDENRWKECAPGIHFFINRQEAVDYVL